MNPEQKAEIMIYNWIRPLVKEVYYNRTNLLSAPVFTVKGGKKPDFIIKDFDNEFAVIEIKPTLKTNQIISGGKQLFYNYFLPYENNETHYYLNNEKIKISYFLFCSENCVKGFIYAKDYDYLNNELDESKKYVMENDMIPCIEEIRTKDFTRELFALFKDYRNKNKDKKFASGLGILILDIKKEVPSYFCVKKFNKYIQMKKYLG